MNEFSLIARSLGCTLLYSLLQATIVSIILFIALKALGKGHAKAKYILSMTALASIFIWFINTWISKWEAFHFYALYKAENSQIQFTKIMFTSATINNDLLSSLPTKLFQSLDPYFPYIVVIYWIGICCMLLRLAIGIRQTQNLRTKGLVNIDEREKTILDKLMGDLNIVTPVRMFFSKNVDIPMVIGSIKPMILLPIATINQLTTDELEAILVHELAHIIRNDYLVNIFQMIVETILFFNPFMWLISANIRREREHCCDDLVIRQLQHPLCYAKALAALESSQAHRLAIKLAATGNKNQLFNRIKRIMEMKKDSMNYSYLAIVICIVLALTFSISHLNTAGAQTKKTKTIKTATQSDSSVTITTHKIIIIDNKGHQKMYDSEDEIPAEEKKAIKEMGDDTKKKRIKEVIVINPDDAHKESDSVLFNSNINVNISKISKETSENDMNWSKINKEMLEAEKTMKDVDWNKINIEMLDAKKAMKDVDWDKINKQLKDVFNDTSAINSTVNTLRFTMSNIDISSAMEAAQENIEKAKKSISDPEMKEDLRKELNKAQKELENAKHELEMIKKEKTFIPPKNRKMGVTDVDMEGMEVMTRKMAKDGLINKDNYVIEKKYGQLYIDGIRQSGEVYKKYKDYFPLNDIKIEYKNDETNK